MTVGVSAVFGEGADFAEADGEVSLEPNLTPFFAGFAAVFALLLEEEDDDDEEAAVVVGGVDGEERPFEALLGASLLLLLLEEEEEEDVPVIGLNFIAFRLPSAKESSISNLRIFSSTCCSSLDNDDGL